MVQYFGTTSKGHPRHYVYITWFLLMAPCLMALKSIEDVQNNFNSVLFLSFLLGCCVYGNISLCGVLAIENALDSISGLLVCFLCFFIDKDFLICRKACNSQPCSTNQLFKAIVFK